MIQIRKATHEDLPILLEFEQGLVEAERPMDPLLKTEKTHYYNLPKMLDHEQIEIAIAEIKGKPVGCGYGKIIKALQCFTYEHYCYLGFMYTIPEARRKGVNKAIMEYLYDWSESRGIYEVRLDVYPNNPAAIKSYEKVGMKTGLHMMRVDLRDRD
jgi:GNAT superfamily N-acetyltransferase